MLTTISLRNENAIEATYVVRGSKEDIAELVLAKATELLQSKGQEHDLKDLIQPLKDKTPRLVCFKLHDSFFFEFKRFLNKFFEENQDLIKSVKHNTESKVEYQVQIFDSESNEVESLVLTKASESYLMNVLYHRGLIIEITSLSMKNIGFFIFKDAVEEVKHFCKYELPAFENFHKTFPSITRDKPKDSKVSSLKAQLLAETALYDENVSRVEVIVRDNNDVPNSVSFIEDTSSAMAYAKMGNDIFRKSLVKREGGVVKLELRQEDNNSIFHEIHGIVPQQFLGHLYDFAKKYKVLDITMNDLGTRGDLHITLDVDKAERRANLFEFWDELTRIV